MKGIKFVVNYDFPGQIEDYVHRIGRTGRAGAKGTSITYFTDKNANKAQDLIKILSQTNSRIPDELYQMAKNASYGGRGRGGGRGRNSW